MKFLAGLAVLVSFVFITGACAPAFAGGSLAEALAEALHKKGVIDDATYADVRKGGTDDEISRKLLDALHKKGVLDDAAYAEISGGPGPEPRRAAAQAAAPASSAPSDRPLDKALSAVEEGIARLSGDTVKMKISGFFQGGWLDDSAGSSVASPPTTSMAPNSGNQFFVRRARLFFAGEVAPKIGFKVSTEFSPTSTMLQDAYLWLDYIPANRLSVGQMKQPFGMENSESLADVVTVNRSLVSNLVVNDTLRDTSGTRSTTLRDMGATLSGRYQDKTSGGRPYGAAWTLGVFNGPGRNIVDDNNHKDFVGRLTLNPFVAGLSVGGSVAAGRTRHAYAGLILDKPRDRFAVEADYSPPAVKGLKLRGEAMWDRRYFSSYVATNATSTSLPADGTGANAITAANLRLWGLRRHAHAFGWYAQASYKVEGAEGGLGLLNGFEPVVRYDYLDEDTSTLTSFSRDDVRTRTTVGFNYYFNRYIRLMVNYEMTHADAGIKYKSLQPIDNVGHELFTTQMQMKF